jgi:hypothetical protein
MADEGLRIQSPSEIAQSFLQTARDQVRAAQAEEWSVVFELADFREVLMRRLSAVTAGPLTDHERRQLAGTIVEIQGLDEEITRRANHESSRLLDEIASTDRGRAVAHGYGWAASTRPSSLIDRYG